MLESRLFASGFSLDWSWLKEWLRTGGLSGLESLVPGVMGVADPQVIDTLAIVSIGFYILFAFKNVADSVFYGRGRTDLMSTSRRS